MAYNGKLLADGILTAAKTTLYTVPANKTAFVKIINCSNTTAVVQTATIYIKKSGGVSRVLNAIVIAAGASAEYLTNSTLCLAAGDQIEGISTLAATFDYLISGLEEV